MITLDDYLRGLGPVPFDLEQNARELLIRVNALLHDYATDRQGANYPVPRVSSGYRTLAINQATAGAAPHSLHLTCEAVDLTDEPHEYDGRLALRPFARWCFIYRDRVLQNHGLAMEDPRATAGRHPWVHLQSRLPHSGSRIYIPSTQWATTLAGQPLTVESIR